MKTIPTRQNDEFLISLNHSLTMLKMKTYIDTTELLLVINTYCQALVYSFIDNIFDLFAQDWLRFSNRILHQTRNLDFYSLTRLIGLCR